MKPLVIVLLPVLFLARICDSPIQGDFGWAASDDRDLVEPEKSLHIPRTYRLARKNLFFYDYDTIWVVYRINEGYYDPNEQFLIALFANNNTPSPVEMDLRQVPVQMENTVGFIRQQYGPLAAGRYLLKIARNSDVVDKVGFQVVPPGGPEEMDDDREELEEEMDEIIRHST